MCRKAQHPLSQELMAICDLVQATGGQQMVRAAYSSGTPSLGVGLEIRPWSSTRRPTSRKRPVIRA